MKNNAETAPVRQATRPERQIKEVTRKGYLVCIEAMRSWAIRTRTIQPDEVPLVDVIDLAQDTMQRQDLSTRTKNAYRAALLWHLRSQDRLAGTDRDALELLEKWAPWKLPRTKLRPRTIKQDDVERINDELLAQGGKWALRTSYWLKAGLATGLRPREWLGATWATADKKALHVQCGKTKLSTPAFLLNAGRFQQRSEPFGTGTVERIVPVEQEFDRMVIDAHLRNIQSVIDLTADPVTRGKQFDQYYHQCRTYMYRACLRIWNGRKSYSLYTMRSQFSANAKAAHGSDATATLMGHSSADSPSAAFYGKASQAHTRGSRAPEFSGLHNRQQPAEAPAIDADGLKPPPAEAT